MWEAFGSSYSHLFWSKFKLLATAFILMNLSWGYKLIFVTNLYNREPIFLMLFGILSLWRINICSFNRKNASDTVNYYYNNHFIVLHDLLRELAIHQSSHEPMEQRKRLIIDINENKRHWWLGEKQQGMIARIFSRFLRWCVKQKPLEVHARTLSVSTG